VIAEADGMASRVRHELFGHAAGDLFRMREQQLLELGEVRERASVRQTVAGFNWSAFTVLIGGEVFRQRANTIVNPILALRDDAVTLAPAADDIIVFQCEAGRVNLRVAARAVFGRAVFSELLANGRRSADVRLDGGDVRRRRRYRAAQNAVEHPYATRNRAGRCTVGTDFEHARSHG
jgi:hypothetical protein